jgi:two-component system chemotaxis response regulator CheB
MTVKPIRVLVIDDSAYNRRTISKILDDIPGVSVVGYAINGEDGLRKLAALHPDLITLDLEMPRMDGFTFLRILMQQRPTPVIVISSRTEDENVFKALELGALDFVGKPSSRSDNQLLQIRDDLIRKVLQCGRADMRKVMRRISTPNADFRPAPEEVDKKRAEASHLVLIGASTGGPPAVQSILMAMKRDYPLMFAVSQHMPAGFTRAFAERLNKFCDLDVAEARTGDLLVPGRALIAPGGKNLQFRRRGAELIAHITDPEEDQRFVPSVDIMFESAARVSPVRNLAVILTGMGNDGAKGTTLVKESGGYAIAEHEFSCVVFGMPKEAIATGSIDRICPLPDIAPSILYHCGIQVV